MMETLLINLRLSVCVVLSKNTLFHKTQFYEENCLNTIGALFPLLILLLHVYIPGIIRLLYYPIPWILQNTRKSRHLQKDQEVQTFIHGYEKRLFTQNLIWFKLYYICIIYDKCKAI